jgi:hypothetical protein
MFHQIARQRKDKKKDITTLKLNLLAFQKAWPHMGILK